MGLVYRRCEDALVKESIGLYFYKKLYVGYDLLRLPIASLDINSSQAILANSKYANANQQSPANSTS